MNAVTRGAPVVSNGVSFVILEVVVSSEQEAPKRLGRPPATKSTDTHRAILDAARDLFGRRGYASVTNRELAAAAGVTTSALYHYADSKLDLYLQVDADMQQRIYDRFRTAEARETTFVGKFRSVLDEAHAMNLEDPSLARFVGAVRADVRRDGEVAEQLSAAARQREDFFLRLVDVGIATGEIDAADRRVVIEFVRLVLVGLVEGPSDHPDQQRLAIDAIAALIEGRLISPVAPATRA